MFTLLSETSLGRRGTIQTTHGPIETPVFFPVATGGAMRGMTLEDLDMLGAQVLLCNTYHLHLQPGEKIVEDAGGLHGFIGWTKPILTDSGGFQVFSLREQRKILEHGVEFRSHLNGDQLFLGPEEAMRIQHQLGADIIMCFDECPPSTAPRAAIIEAVDRTLRWAVDCKKVHKKLLTQKKPKKPTQPKQPTMNDSSVSSVPSVASESSPLLFGIVQGGLERDLREKCASELRAIGFDGYAIGGLAVGETEVEMYDVLGVVCPLLPADQPRYLMGVGRVHQHRTAVAKGIDMFDCVLPMREARHGEIYVSNGETIRITHSEFISDHSIIDEDSPSPLSRKHRKSYLAHLFRSKERLAETIACLQNVGVTVDEMKKLREMMEAKI